MPDTMPELPPPLPVAPPRKRGVAWLAWIVILLVVGFEVFWPRLRPRRHKAAGEDRAQQVLDALQARQIIGMGEVLGQRATLYAEAKKTLDTGPVADRLRFVVVAGELMGPAEALGQLGRLEEQTAKQGIEMSEGERAVAAALTRLYWDRGDGDAALFAVGGLAAPDGAPWTALGQLAAGHGREPPTLTSDDTDLIRRELGWSGELAVAPPDSPERAAALAPARRFARTYLTALGAALVIGLLGLAGLVALLICFVMGRVPPAMPPPTTHGGIYAEAFAAYMLTFLGLGVVRAFLPAALPDVALGGLAMLVSLGVGLAWPVLRGVPWRQVRQELGLTLGRHPLLEPLVGVGGYALVLPVFGIGVIVTALLITAQRARQVGAHPEEHFNPIESPTHPIVEWLEHPDWRLLIQVVILASVLAPLVEETMFRGALYRHLRNATARMGRAGSFLVSALVVSFIFAVIHPQGILAVPALMSLAFGLTILREWRGSLLPSMMVHGIHNGLTTYVLVQALRG
jgi:membrane protease YdiL (CAAX protease family)